MEENYILIFARAFNIYIFSDKYDSDKIQKILRAFLIIYESLFIDYYSNEKCLILRSHKLENIRGELKSVQYS